MRPLLTSISKTGHELVGIGICRALNHAAAWSLCPSCSAGEDISGVALESPEAQCCKLKGD